MKYEDSNILAFTSDSSKKELSPEVNSKVKESAGLRENAGKESSGKESSEKENLMKKNPVEESFEKENLEKINLEKENPGKVTLEKENPEKVNLEKENSKEENPEVSCGDKAENYLENFSNQATMLTPEKLKISLSKSLSDSLSENINDPLNSYPFNSSDAVLKIESLSKTELPSFPEASLEPPVFRGSKKQDFPFEPLVGYEKGVLGVPSPEEAFGIVTTGIEPLEITPTGAVITGYITSARRNEIRLGTYVFVPYEDGEKLFARVGKLQYRQEFMTDDATEIHSMRTLSARGSLINEADYKFLACLDPLCILYLKADQVLARRMADRIPRPNTPILPVTDRLEVQTGLNIPEEGIFLGHLSVGGELVKTHSEPETVAYYLRNDYSMGDPLIFRHMLICGSTGTGKTFLSKNILRQFMTENNRYRLRSSPDKARKNPCFVIMDPQDEYSQLFEDNQTLTEQDKFRFESESVTYGRIQSTKAFVAKVEGQRYPGDKSRAVQTEFTIPFSFVKNNHWLIAAAGMTELQYIGLEVLLGDFFKSSVPHTYLNFINHVNNEGTRSYYVDSGKLHESSYDGIVRRVKSSSFSKVFDQDATPITNILDKIFKPGQISVFPTEYISDTRIRDLIVLTIMSLIVDNKLSTTGKDEIKETPIILALDEAHRYLSKANGEHSRLIISRFADAARQGRKEALGLFLITQDPQDIDDTVFKQINTKVILNLNNDAAITSLKVPKEYEKRIPYLKKGQMIIHSPDNSDIVEIIGLSNCVVKHQ